MSGADPHGPEGVPPTVHGSALAVAGTGVLIRGAAGSGKSTLALALIEDFRQDAVLVADDQVALEARRGRIYASPPVSIAGLIEVRGVGIVQRPYLREAELRLVVDLLPAEHCPRLPQPDQAIAVLLGCELPRLMLPIGTIHGDLRLRVALRAWAV